MPTDVISMQDFNSAEDLLAALAPTDARWGSNPRDWIFRGQRDASWHLVPKALRAKEFVPFMKGVAVPPPGLGTVLPQSEAIEVMQAELAVIRSFFHAADMAGESIPGDTADLRDPEYQADLVTRFIERCALGENYLWPPTKMAFLFGLAQHYGIPTRLLDWTWKPRVAAYFATEGAVREAAVGSGLAVWAIHVNFFETGWQELLPVDGNKDGTFRLDIVTAPQATNPNLRAQAGLFTVDRKVWEPMPLDDLLKSAAAAETKKDPDWAKKLKFLRLPIVQKLILPVSEAPKLLRLLAHEGTSAATVYPGYQGVVASLKERLRWDRIP